MPEELKGDCHYELNEGERLGFCFPIHGWQPPHIVRQFIRRATFVTPSATPPYLYLLCTCGDTVGNALKMLDRELAAKGLPVADARCSLVMPESYVCLPFMYTDTPEKKQTKLLKADADLKRFTTIIMEKKATGDEYLVKGSTPRLYTNVIGAYFNNRMITDRPFRVDNDLCVGCGRCIQACPTGCIRLETRTDGRQTPAWSHDGSCTCCLACYHHCPHHAINYGTRTRKRGQYVFHGIPETSTPKHTV